jgi:hypothetical protein
MDIIVETVLWKLLRANRMMPFPYKKVNSLTNIYEHWSDELNTYICGNRYKHHNNSIKYMEHYNLSGK